MTNDNIINNLSDSFKYAISDPKKILIGAAFVLIYLIPLKIISLLLHIKIIDIDFNTGLILTAVTIVLFLIGSILISGYYVKIMRTTLENAVILPEWVGFFNLFKDGILFVIGQNLVFIAFMIIPFILMIVGARLIMPAGMFETIKIEYIFTYIIILFIGMLLSLPFIILYGFYIILANINFAKNGFFGFFDYKKVLNKFSIKYVLLAIIVFVFSFAFLFMSQIVLSIVMTIVTIIPSIFLLLIDNIVLTFVFSLISSLITSVILSILFITMSIFSHRAYATYYKNVT